VQRHVRGSDVSEPTVTLPNGVSFDVVAPGGQRLEAVADARPLTPFSLEATSFLDALSEGLLKSPATRAFPELMALGFWMRPASIRRLAARHGVTGDDTATEAPLLRARGTAFHIAPANVDTIFVYSWMVSLLAGNSNVVRLSRKISPQTEALISIVSNLLDQQRHAAVRARTLLVRYEPRPETTSYFSSRCDVRVVWGGDTTVNDVRRTPLPPLSTELVFGDRFSIAVIDASAWLEAASSARERAIRGFVNDGYWFMQMACSSPRLVVWVGDRAAAASARANFWDDVRAELGARDLGLTPREFISKRAATAGLAVVRDTRLESEATGDLTRVWLDTPSIAHHEWHCGAGLYWESAVETLEELAPFIDRRVQTVAHFGFSEDRIREFVALHQPRGGDRWVQFGKALDFDDVWDGFDLVTAFGRYVSIAADD
jgi:acyl-CoA reductase LuxC